MGWYGGRGKWQKWLSQSKMPGPRDRGIVVNILRVHAAIILGQFDGQDDAGEQEQSAAAKAHPERIHGVSQETAGQDFGCVHDVAERLALGDFFHQGHLDPFDVLVEVADDGGGVLLRLLSDQVGGVL